MAKSKPPAPELFFNRELSWLEFNERVLQEGCAPEVPLLERLKFLAIVSSNLDEFYMVRVAGLRQQKRAGLRRRDPAGLTAAEQLAAIARRVHKMVADQEKAIAAVLAALARHNLSIVEAKDWSPEQRRLLRAHFANELLPVLTPLAIEELAPPPILAGGRLHLAVQVRQPAPSATPPRVVAIPIPPQFPRFLTLPAEQGVHVARLEEVIAAHLGQLFPGTEVVGQVVFRVTRDADAAVTDDDAGDLLHAMEEAVLSRRRRDAVRLEVWRPTAPALTRWLQHWLELGAEEVFEVKEIIDATALFELAGRRGFDALRYRDWSPQPPPELAGAEDLWTTIRDHDVLLIHPYESFDPVVQLIEQAADDAAVLAIKLILYRTSGDSPIIRALERAARGGKQVTALVELKARFDEARNIQWARRLEDAGCNVIYGVAGLKTHAKALLIVRREAARVRRYVHLATGNYNDRTARLYSDVGLLTADRDFGADVAAFFNLLTGYSEAINWTTIAIAPTELRHRLLELIEREIQSSTRDEPGAITAKLNSLQDPELIRALYRASRAGVRVRLNVRGICCLRPGVAKLSKTIEVRSIVDRYLEHARVFSFRNGGREEVYLSSADWMTRNLDKRIELLVPVRDPNLRRRLLEVLELFFRDNCKARVLRPDGSWIKVAAGQPAVRAQEVLHREAVAAGRAAAQAGARFKPLAAPKD